MTDKQQEWLGIAIVLAVTAVFVIAVIWGNNIGIERMTP